MFKRKCHVFDRWCSRGGNHPDQRILRYSNAMCLVPTIRPGKLWQRHRNWLEGEGPLYGSSYVVVNLRTSRRYRWFFWGNFEEHARFGVSSLWVLFHPWWYCDPWQLVYNGIELCSCRRKCWLRTNRFSGEQMIEFGSLIEILVGLSKIAEPVAKLLQRIYPR